MTDARLPERWLNDRRLLRLRDDTFRLFATSLMWSVANKTDGVLDDDDLPLIPGVNPGIAGELAKAGLWKREQDHWLIVEFEETQTTSADLDHLAYQRRQARDRKRRERARRVTRDVPRDVTADSTRTGQARTGQAPRNVVPGTGEHEIAPNGDGSGLATPSQTRKRVHDGPNNHGPDVQHDSIEVQRQSQATDRYAREDAL